MRVKQLQEMSVPDPDAKRVYTTAEAARYIAMSESFLRQARMDGDRENRTPGPPFLKIGRAVRYLKHDLDAWLERHKASATDVFHGSQDVLPERSIL
jgi:predicted DNA-binding transcriptional regulator AlpA